jgi:hypothetical protein
MVDFRQWKVSSADEKKAVLHHKDGHFMTLALKSLSPIHRDQVKRLAKGGTVNAPAYPPDFNEQGTSEAGHAVRMGNPEKAKALHKTTIQNQKNDKTNRKNFADGTPDGTVGDDDLDNAEQAVDNTVGAAPVREISPAQTATMQPAYGSEPAVSDATLLQDKTLNAPGAVQLQQRAANEQQMVDAAKAKATVPALQENIQRQQAIAQQIPENYQELKKHTDDFNNYIQANPINSNDYLESRSDGQKVGTAIGLLLGGIGGRGNGNVAMDFLNKNIDRNIDAQKENAKNQHTIWGAYEHLYGDSTIATNLAKVSANDILARKIDLAAAKLGTPQAKATADAFRATKLIESSQLLNDSAGKLGEMRTGGGMPTGQPTLGHGQDTGPGALATPESQPLLNQGAEHRMRSIPYDPSMKQFAPEVAEQYKNASQADKSLQGLGEVFGDAAKDATTYGRFKGSAGHVLGGVGAALGAGVGLTLAGGAGALKGAGVGGGIGEGVGRALPTTNSMRQYDADTSAIRGYVSSALRGSPLAPSQIEETVQSNLPIAGDSADTISKKLKTLREFVRKHIPTDKLKMAGMTSE